jgi:putative transposase
MAAWLARFEGCARGHSFFSPSFPTCYSSESISRDLDLWAYANAVTLEFSRPGKPTHNGFIEAFNSKLRAECLRS